MKRIWKTAISLLLTLALLTAALTVPAAAADSRSSLYLSYYRAWLVPQSGAKIDVAVDVQAVGYMDYVGASKVVMYESADGGETWTGVRTYLTALEEGMLVEDDVIYFDVAITHQGTAGYKYCAIVTVYAGDSTGYDTREYQTTVVTAIP